MSPRTGRPTESPKRNRLEIRLSEEEMAMLEYCVSQTGRTKTDIVKQGVKETYLKLKTKK